MSEKTNIINISNYDDFIERFNSNNKFFIKFHAEWCRPCKILESTIDSMPSKADFIIFNVNIDNFVKIADVFNVSSIPHIVYIERKDEKMPSKFDTADIIAFMQGVKHEKVQHEYDSSKMYQKMKSLIAREINI